MAAENDEIYPDWEESLPETAIPIEMIEPFEIIEVFISAVDEPPNYLSVLDEPPEYLPFFDAIDDDYPE
jgi:hypothetical protein